MKYWSRAQSDHRVVVHSTCPKRWGYREFGEGVSDEKEPSAAVITPGGAFGSENSYPAPHNH